MMSSGIFAENAKRELIDRVSASRIHGRNSRVVNGLQKTPRQQAESIIRRARYLAPTDRMLIVGVFERGMSSAEVAELAGVNAATARRRMRKLLDHMASDLFTYLMVHLDDWEADRRAVALYRLMQRRSGRDTARETGLSLHFVRVHENVILNDFANWFA